MGTDDEMDMGRGQWAGVPDDSRSGERWGEAGGGEGGWPPSSPSMSVLVQQSPVPATLSGGCQPLQGLGHTKAITPLRIP